MTANASLAERSAAYDARKRAGGLCIEGGCWRKAARGRVRCHAHLTAAREAAKATRAQKNGDGRSKPAAPASQPVKEATNAASLPRSRKHGSAANG